MTQPWYIGGLHFECTQCGDCCCGPEEGFIWITKKEQQMLADHLGISIEELKQKYLRRFGTRSSIIEDKTTKDCIFLSKSGGCQGCSIYKFRPNQCRTWPFWSGNLKNPYEWNSAAARCPGINRGRLYTYEEIQKIKKQKSWWDDSDEQNNK